MKKILCALLAAAMLLALCACGSSGSKDTYNDAGYYEIFSVDEGDETLTASDFASMDWTIYLQLNDDGTGVLDMDDGDITDLTWKDGSINDGTGDVPYVLAGGMLTLDLSDSDGTFVMIFKKGTAPAAGAAESADAGESAGVSSFADRFSRAGDAEPAEDTAEDTAEEPAEEPEAASAPAAGGDFTPVSGDIRDLHVEILSAESFTDIDDKDAVRFYYDVTNNSDELAVPWLLDDAAEEDGYELVSTYARSEDDVPEYGNASMYIQPGVTVRCIAEYSFRPDGSELTFTLSYYGDDGITATFDPKNLPGRPGEWEADPITDPDYYAGYIDDGESDYAHVYIDSAETAKEASWWGDGTVIRVYFQYTNLGEETSYFRDKCYVYAFQDGIELDYGYTEDDVESDDADYTDVAPGETITVSRVWLMRSDSPIEIAVYDWETDDVICACSFS